MFMGSEEGREEGRKEGKREGDTRRLISSVNDVMERFKVSLQEACDTFHITVTEYDRMKGGLGL